MAAVTLRSAVETKPAAAVPLIKGIFVNSHIDAVRRVLGEEGVRLLEERFGAPLHFRNTEDVPVHDEVRIIEQALDLLHPETPPAARAYEAGRLHFRNFSTTPWAKILFTVFPRNYRFMLLHCKTVAERVFKGVEVDATETGPCRVLVVMANADYPLDHFKGFFHEWMHYFGLAGNVEGRELGPGIHEYDAHWRDPA